MATGHLLPGLKARRIAAGMSISRLAEAAACSDVTIKVLEDGGNCDPWVTERILDALGSSVAITSSSIANPSVITTAAHTFLSGDTVTIASHTSCTPDINGENVVTVTAGTTFTVPVNVTDDGVGGTARLSATTLGKVQL